MVTRIANEINVIRTSSEIHKYFHHNVASGGHDRHWQQKEGKNRDACPMIYYKVDIVVNIYNYKQY